MIRNSNEGRIPNRRESAAKSDNNYAEMNLFPESKALNNAQKSMGRRSAEDIKEKSKGFPS